jgi:hypothetical protein
MADWETVRDLAVAFPGAEEDIGRSQPAFRVRGKLFVWMSPHEKGALCALRVCSPNPTPARSGSAVPQRATGWGADRPVALPWCRRMRGRSDSAR